MRYRSASLSLIFVLLSAPAWSQGWGTVWLLDGQSSWEPLASAVAGGVDIDQDGFDDFLVGAEHWMNNGVSSSGAAFVYSGADASVLYAVYGQEPFNAAGGYFGSAVAWIDDADADGVSDFVVGAKEMSLSSHWSHAKFGSVGLYSGADGSLIREHFGTETLQQLGSSVAAAGDLDGDGVADYLAGAQGASVGGLSAVGSVYVYSGADGSLLLQLDGPLVAYSFFGACADLAGDVDLDGAPDYLIGSPSYTPAGGANDGAAFLYSGATGALIHQFVGAKILDKLGTSVSAGGDLDGDGINDLLIGAPEHQPPGSTNPGAVDAYSGADGSLLYRFVGEAGQSGYGEAVCIPGDLDHDGVDDVVVGATRALFGVGSYPGALYFYSGADGHLIQRLDGWFDNQRLGTAVAAAGDLTLSGSVELIACGDGHSSTGGYGAGSVAVLLDTALPTNSDDDGDALPYYREVALSTDPLDQDSDDDGMSDGEEFLGDSPYTAVPTEPTLADSDGDGVQDGTELGIDAITWSGGPPNILGTDPLVFQPDLDPISLTDPWNPDSDGGGVTEGAEDFDGNGRVDLYETDPLDPVDDRTPGSLAADWPTVSASQAQVTILTMDFSVDFGGHDYLILGSLAGSAPGFVYQGVEVPLVLDSLTMMLAGGAPPPMLVYFAGALDPSGAALAYIATRPGEVAAFVGSTVWFSAVSLDPGTGLLSNATTALALAIVP